jgi:hypothetical protein
MTKRQGATSDNGFIIKNNESLWNTVPLGDWLEKKNVPAIIIK